MLGVVIDDRDLGAPIAAGAVVLGVGAASPDAIRDLIVRGEAAGAAAVVVKHNPDRSPLTGRRAEAIPLVEVASDLEWAQLHMFVRTALLHVGSARVGGQQTLFDVANAIALRVDGAVVIEDEQLRVVAYSSLGHAIDDARRATILGRQIPDRYVTQLRNAGITQHLDVSPDPVRFDIAGDGMLPRLAIALRVEGRTIGLLWTITDDEREANARSVMADAAPDVAVELHRHLTADTRYATDRGAAARQLLEGRPVRGITDLLGAPPHGFVVLLLRPEPDDDAATEAMARTAQLATVYVDAYRVPVLVAPAAGPYVEAVVGLTSTTTEARARVLLDELADRTRSTFGIEVRGAMGSVVGDVRDLPRSRRDGLAVLELLIERDTPECAAYEEVQVEVAFREILQQAEAGEHLTRGAVVDLASSTDRGDATIVATVRAYLSCGGDVSRTSVEVGAHRNTVRYRVQRFEALTGTDLTDPLQRLVTELRLRLPAAPA